MRSWLFGSLVIAVRREVTTCVRQITVTMSKVYNFIKKRLQHRCFPVNFTKFSRTPFSQNTFGRLFLECSAVNSQGYVGIF